ncbi:MAG: glyoxylate/hydroxypyruvate reductase A, partial [Lautropia sp.]|nr:glyoxylate/hydroxypyruvate reductase A [Lautropia sp.]
AYLVNTSRGPIVDQAALVDALAGGAIAGAGLDVFDEEPLPAASPLWRHPHLTLLPHISADTDPASASLIVARNVRRWRESGQIPQPVVDRQRGY